MKARFALLTAASALPLLAAYTYFYTDTLASVNATYWYSNGSFTTGANGLNASAANGGTVISKVAQSGQPIRICAFAGILSTT